MARVRGIFFDQDGVIVDTERDGHRVAFNRAFQELGCDFQWDPGLYHQLLQISGGKERIRHYLRTTGSRASPAEDALVEKLHRRKTDFFLELVEAGALPLRAGVKRLMREVNRAGVILGICTTSNERAARSIIATLLRDIRVDLVLAGDVVARKKPDPEIYLRALRETGLAARECAVIEDSRNGVEAAKAAGLFVVATTNPYTENEDLSRADLVVSCLGDPDGERGNLRQGAGLPGFDGVLTLTQLQACFDP